MDNICQLVESILEALPQEYGEVVKIHQTGTAPFIVVFQDIPWNWGVRLSTAMILDFFVKSKVIDLVGVDGVHERDGVNGDISSAAAELACIPHDDLKRILSLFLLKQLRFTGVDYCRLFYPINKPPFTIYGVEHKKFRNQLLKQFFNNYSGFLEAEEKYGAVELDNLLTKMNEIEAAVSALVCVGHFPDIICEELERRDISYARITAKSSVSDNRELYWRLIQGKEPPNPKALSCFIHNQLHERFLTFLKPNMTKKLQSEIDWEDYQIQYIENSNSHSMGKIFDEYAAFVTYLFSIVVANHAEDSNVLERLDKKIISTHLDELAQSGVSGVFPKKFNKLSHSERFSFVELLFSVHLLHPCECNTFPQPEIHYIVLELVLSDEILEYIINPEFEKIPEYESIISRYLERVPREDIDKLCQSSIVSSKVKSEIQRQRMPSYTPKRRVSQEVERFALEGLISEIISGDVYYYNSEDFLEFKKDIEGTEEMFKKSNHERLLLSSADIPTEIKANLRKKITLSAIDELQAKLTKRLESIKKRLGSLILYGTFIGIISGYYFYRVWGLLISIVLVSLIRTFIKKYEKRHYIDKIEALQELHSIMSGQSEIEEYLAEQSMTRK